MKTPPELAFEALAEEINRFQRSINTDSEVGIVANGGGLIIHVEHVRQSGQMIVFDGVDPQSRNARLVQHFTQTNVQMLELEKLQEEARRIGF